MSCMLLLISPCLLARLYVIHTCMFLKLTCNKGRTASSFQRAVQEIFSTLGPVGEIKIIKDKLTGLSAGYGFVRYQDPRAAEMALQSLNGRVLHGQVCPPSLHGYLATARLRGGQLLVLMIDA